MERGLFKLRVIGCGQGQKAEIVPPFGMQRPDVGQHDSVSNFDTASLKFRDLVACLLFFFCIHKFCVLDAKLFRALSGRVAATELCPCISGLGVFGIWSFACTYRLYFFAPANSVFSMRDFPELWLGESRCPS